MTRAYNTATTQQNSGGAVAGVTAGKNYLINGGMDVWQRGTSVAFGTYVYTSDRWQGYANGSHATATRQVTGDTTNLPNIQYCARVQRNSGSTTTNAIQFAQSLETVNSIPLAGKTVTFSFYARKGANYSATSDALGVYLRQGTGTDERVLAGYTGETHIITSTATLTTTWQRFTYTGTFTTAATEVGAFFNYVSVSTAGANDYFEVTGLQLEVGSVATPFSRAAGTIQGELAACQRYYYRTTSDNDRPTGHAAIGQNTSGGQGYGVPKVTMRVGPTSVDYASLKVDEPGVASYAITSLTLGNTQPNAQQFAWSTAGTQIGQGRNYILQTSATNGYIGFNAEL